MFHIPTFMPNKPPKNFHKKNTIVDNPIVILWREDQSEHAFDYNFIFEKKPNNIIEIITLDSNLYMIQNEKLANRIVVSPNILPTIIIQTICNLDMNMFPETYPIQNRTNAIARIIEKNGSNTPLSELYSNIFYL